MDYLRAEGWILKEGPDGKVQVCKDEEVLGEFRFDINLVV